MTLRREPKKATDWPRDSVRGCIECEFFAPKMKTSCGHLSVHRQCIVEMFYFSGGQIFRAYLSSCLAGKEIAIAANPIRDAVCTSKE
jgi:hypothetical protein